MTFQYSFAKLPKAQKDVVRFADADFAMDLLLNNKQNQFIHLYDILADLFCEDPDGATEDQKEILLLPIQIFGKQFGQELTKMRNNRFATLKKEKRHGKR